MKSLEYSSMNCNFTYWFHEIFKNDMAAYSCRNFGIPSTQYSLRLWVVPLNQTVLFDIHRVNKDIGKTPHGKEEKYTIHVCPTTVMRIKLYHRWAALVIEVYVFKKRNWKESFTKKNSFVPKSAANLTFQHWTPLTVRRHLFS